MNAVASTNPANDVNSQQTEMSRGAEEPAIANNPAATNPLAEYVLPSERRIQNGDDDK